MVRLLSVKMPWSLLSSRCLIFQLKFYRKLQGPYRNMYPSPRNSLSICTWSRLQSQNRWFWSWLRRDHLWYFNCPETRCYLISYLYARCFWSAYRTGHWKFVSWYSLLSFRNKVDFSVSWCRARILLRKTTSPRSNYSRSWTSCIS